MQMITLVFTAQTHAIFHEYEPTILILNLLLISLEKSDLLTGNSATSELSFRSHIQPLRPKLPADIQIFIDPLEGQVRRSAWQQQGSSPPCLPLHGVGIFTEGFCHKEFSIQGIKI